MFKKSKKGDMIGSVYFVIIELVLVATICLVMLKYVDLKTKDTDYAQSFLAIDNGLLISTISHANGNLDFQYTSKKFDMNQFYFTYRKNEITTTTALAELGRTKAFKTDLNYAYGLEKLEKPDYISYEKSGNYISNYQSEESRDYCQTDILIGKKIGIVSDNALGKSYPYMDRDSYHAVKNVLEKLDVMFSLNENIVVVKEQDELSRLNDVDIILVLDVSKGSGESDFVLTQINKNRETGKLSCLLLSEFKSTEYYSSYRLKYGENDELDYDELRQFEKPTIELVMDNLEDPNFNEDNLLANADLIHNAVEKIEN